MARPKRGSIALDKAQRRIASLKSISPTLNLGNGSTIASYDASIEDARLKLEAYNTALSALDQTYSALVESEKSLAEQSERMLIGVAFTYGKNSAEYEMAGGTKKSDRKRSVRRKSEVAAATVA